MAPQTILTLAANQNVEGVNVRLPDRIEVATVDVAVLQPNGAAAEGAVVEVQDTNGWVLRRVQANESGRATLRLFVGQTYRIHAYELQGSRSQEQPPQPMTVRIEPTNRPISIQIGPRL